MKKIGWNSNYTTVAVYVFLVAAASVLFAAFVENFSVFWGWACTIVGYLLPFIYGFALAYILSPLLRKIEKPLGKTTMKPQHRRGLALLLTYLLVFSVMVLFSVVVSPILLDSIGQIVKNVGSYTEKVNEVIAQIMSYIPNESVSNEVEAMLNNLMTGLYSFVSTALLRAVTVATRLASSIIEVVMGIIISIYMLADKEKLIAQLKKVISAVLPEKAMVQVLAVAHDSNVKFSGFIVGKIIDSIIIGILCAIGMALFKMPFVALVSLIVGITNVIPYFGPFIGAIPGIILVFIGGDPMQAVVFGLFVLALQQFDGNILGPAILGQSTGLSAMWVIFAILLFGGLYGFVGMLIGVPLLAVIFGILHAIINLRLRKKGMSDKVEDYASEKHKLL